MTAFATASDMFARYDVRTLGDICADDGSRVPEEDLTSNAPMNKALETATGKIKAAVLRAERYTTAELDALTGDSKQYLVDMTCRIAMWGLWQRKPYKDDQQRTEIRADADDALELLRKGDHVFDIDRQKDAGTPKVETVTRVEIETQWGLMADIPRGRFFPARRSYRNR